MSFPEGQFVTLSYRDDVHNTPSPLDKDCRKDSSNPMPEGTILKMVPADDFHVHFRDGPMLTAVAPFTARQFARAIIMPNLNPPVRTVDDARTYHARIMNALPPNCNFTPLMTLYLTDTTTADDIKAAHASGLVHACKLYPAGATTNSAFGVNSLSKLSPALTAMQEVGMVLSVHGEVTTPDVDIFDREARFVTDVLPKLLSDYPTLKIVLEHVTTAEAVRAVQEGPHKRLAATITAHHLLYSRQALFEGAKIHPHMYCLPILKRESHRLALIDAIVNNKAGCFFAGTDSAPHTRDTKLCADGCAGIFTGYCALQLYIEVFDRLGIAEEAVKFTSVYGARFYGLPINKGYVELEKRSVDIPAEIKVAGSEPVVPLRAGQSVRWQFNKRK